MNNIVEVKNVVKSFKDKIVLNNVSFSMKPGEIVGFVGQNGAGKSTLMKCICNLMSVDSGSISICGKEVVKQREEALSYVSCMIEGPGLFDNMTGKENLELMATLNHASKDKLHEMMEFTQIGDQLKNKAVSYYSMGMKQRTGLAVALMKDPKVLLLDEPMNGLDATGIQNLREELIRLARENNVALLISSHQLGEIEKMADRIIGIHFGKIKEISMEEKENVYELETDKAIADKIDLRIIEQKGNAYKLEVDSVMDLLSNLEKQGIQVKNITQIHKTLEDVYNEFIHEASS